MNTNTSALWINDGGFSTTEIEAGIRAAEAAAIEAASAGWARAPESAVLVLA